MKAFETYQAQFIEDQYERWRGNSQSVSPDWQHFFLGFDMGRETPAGEEGRWDEGRMLQQARVEALKYRYRDMGHLLACMDPLEACPVEHPLLALSAFGLKPEDLETRFFTRRFSSDRMAPLKEIVQALKETYCRSIGVEYMHLQDPEERRWLQERMEPVRNQPALEPGGAAARFWKNSPRPPCSSSFSTKNMSAVTRFSLEGGDGLIPMLDALVNRLARSGGREMILGMAHRGRLNVQANILHKSVRRDLRPSSNTATTPSTWWAPATSNTTTAIWPTSTPDGRWSMRIFLVNNPSHLEAVDPVVEGIARARQDMHGEQRAPAGAAGADPWRRRLCRTGDRGRNPEHVPAGGLRHRRYRAYRHQQPDRLHHPARGCPLHPLFHRRGQDADGAHFPCARRKPGSAGACHPLAADYRDAFGKDVVVDLVCYRRYGHNEGDEPYFTQPLMYDRIRQRVLAPQALCGTS